jgi:hypothetical protein
MRGCCLVQNVTRWRDAGADEEGTGQSDRARYQNEANEKKKAILDEFVKVTGYYRKHAIRLFRSKCESKPVRRTGRQIYNEAARD